MKKVLKFLGIILLILIIFSAAGIGYAVYFLPNVGKAKKITVAATPERIQRGKYLANCVAVCIDCHSKRDWSKFAGPITPGTEGEGGDRFDRTMGFPGVFYAKNITPYNLKNWTDGEIFRVITTGVAKDGQAIFPVMPYHYYGQLDTEDIYSIIAYVRTLPSIKNDVPARQIDFPMNIIMHTIPVKAPLGHRPSASDTLAYGKYLITMAGCVECHTPADKGQIIAGKEFGGGREFDMPGGILRSANITPDPTGIGNWTESQFIQRFKMYDDSAYHSPTLTPKDFNSIMPWMMYSRMTESDLASIYTYLKTIKPIHNTVEKFTRHM